MKPEPLAPAYAKIKRAEAHIKELNSAIGAFLETPPYKIVSEINADGTEVVWRFRPDGIPDDIEAIAADAVHNLRTPLDKMLTALVDHLAPPARKGKRHLRVHFPVGKSPKLFEDALKGQKKHFRSPVRADVIKLLRSTEAYPGGKSALISALHDIDVDEKHHPILTPIRLSVTKKQIGPLKTRKGFPLIFGSRQGAHLIPAPHARPGKWDMVQSDATRQPILRKAPDGRERMELERAR